MNDSPLSGRMPPEPSLRTGEGVRTKVPDRVAPPRSHAPRSELRRRNGRTGPGGKRVLSALCAVVGVGLLMGCATKGDIRELSGEIRQMQARQDTLLRSIAQIRSSVLDSLRSQSDALFSLRGNVNRQLLEIQEQLVMVQELAGQSQRALQGIRDQIEARRAQVLPQLPPGLEAGGGEVEEGGEGETGPASSAPDTLFNMGVTMFNRGSLQTARRAFDRFLVQFPNHLLASDARFYLADIASQENRLEEAVELFLEVPELHPTSDRVPEALYRAGLLRLETGDEGEARELFERVVNSYPESRVADLARERLEEIG